jgi:hypothetical protein
MDLYKVDIGYSCFSIEVENGIVKHAPGIAKWTIGKKWTEVEEYYKSKKSANIKKIRL